MNMSDMLTDVLVVDGSSSLLAMRSCLHARVLRSTTGGRGCPTDLPVLRARPRGTGAACTGQATMVPLYTNKMPVLFRVLCRLGG